MKKTYFVALLLAFLTIGVNALFGEEVTSTFVASKNYSEGMTLSCSESSALTWVSSAKPTGFDSNGRGLQWSKTATTITSTIANATITKVAVTIASNSTLGDTYTLSVSVGGTLFGSQAITKDATSLEFSGSASGEISINTAKGTKSTYIKSIIVTYTSLGIKKPTLYLIPFFGKNKGLE